MAEVTVAGLTHDYWGGRRVMLATLSSVDNNDIWTTGMQAIDMVLLVPTVSTSNVGYTVSGGTVTFKIESGTLTGLAIAIGT